ncbi:MAG: CDP-glucose 4,6-dehydratase, partial [Chloroflexi bacterium]|nr:CDP-glucose 4,6-dehydratase [Chloroflexota bacterium]
MGIGQSALEGVVMRVANADFWAGRRVLITGHTGFKGSWLSLLLSELGAEVAGLALDPPTSPSIFEQARIAELFKRDIRGDVTDSTTVLSVLSEEDPEIVFHLAAQPLVRDSYAKPVDTFLTNVMGTVNVLEACRQSEGVRAVVVVTTDKVYENKEWYWGYRETDALGGRDPYSASKACAEIVTASYRSSFTFGSSGAVGTARAGNVIGGGDWARDRLIPDCMRAFRDGREVVIRYPESIRPWQHVLDCLHGYVLLAESLAQEGTKFAEAFNFGPSVEELVAVGTVVEAAGRLWGPKAMYRIDASAADRHEAGLLRLDNTRALAMLHW